MTIFLEFRKFINSILYWIYLWLLFSFFFFLFGLGEVVIFGRSYLLPVPRDDSFSILFFNKMQSDLLPPDVHLIVTNPLDAFVSQILISLVLAFVTTFPFFLYKIIKYLTPALFLSERKAILRSLFPGVFLFLAGCVFAYYFLVPTTFNILYPYATRIGATPFFAVDEFISSVLGLSIATGVMFLLPLFMILLSFLHIIEPIFWRSKWRHAILFFLIFSAIITPDGTGVTMALLFLPMALLYFSGCVLTARFDKSKISLVS